MMNSLIASIIFILVFGFSAWSFCKTEHIATETDAPQLNIIKISEQQSAAKSGASRLRFDKQFRVHRFFLHIKPELTLDQGF